MGRGKTSKIGNNSDRVVAALSESEPTNRIDTNKRKTAAQRYRESVRNSTTATNKSYEQVSRETDTLTNYPNGTQIEVYENGSWVTYTAHDPWYTGRNGRMLQRRRYSIVEAGNKNMPVSLSSTSDPYNIAQKQWRKKR